MLQRLLIERMEHRILVGTIAFLAIMVLVGWIAINEGGRMAAFERQYTARSIERGAALFNVNCSECHGTDGLGVVGRAPALNNPYLFGYDFLGTINRERDLLNIELNGEGTTDERKAEIEARLAELDQEEQSVRTRMQTAIGAGYDPAAPSRLANLGWAGSLHNFIYTTLVHGRPVSASYWPQSMQAWAQTAGGPLRNDQLEDLTQFIMNWDKGDNWAPEDLNAVRQWPVQPVDPATVVMTGGDPVVGTDIEAIMTEIVNYTGDPQAGQTLYNGALACAGCHLNAAVAPTTEGTWTRATTVRMEDPALAGFTPEEFLIHSIVLPNEYVAPGYPAGVMPPNFGDRLTYQDLADLIAYLQSHDEPIE